jgi:hypothetical protein
MVGNTGSDAGSITFVNPNANVDSDLLLDRCRGGWDNKVVLFSDAAGFLHAQYRRLRCHAFDDPP